MARLNLVLCLEKLSRLSVLSGVVLAFGLAVLPSLSQADDMMGGQSMGTPPAGNQSADTSDTAKSSEESKTVQDHQKTKKDHAMMKDHQKMTKDHATMMKKKGKKADQQAGKMGGGMMDDDDSMDSGKSDGGMEGGDM